MKILLPKSSNTGKWEEISHSSSGTQKEQLHLYGTYLSKLSIKNQEIEEKVEEISVLKDEILKTKKDAADSLRITRDTRGLVYFGFFALIFVVIGIAFGYFEFVSTSALNNTDKSDLSKQFAKNQMEIINLKSCLDISRWLNPKCLQY